MKKLLACVMILPIFLFGCSSESTAKSPVTEFSSVASLTVGEDKTECEIISTVSEVTLTINSGNTKGLVYRCDGDNIKSEYSDITVSNSRSDFKSSYPYLLYSSVKTLRAADTLTKDTSDESCTTYTGCCDSGEFKAEVETSTGYIRSVEFEQYDFKAELSNVKEHK